MLLGAGFKAHGGPSCPKRRCFQHGGSGKETRASHSNGVALGGQGCPPHQPGAHESPGGVPCAVQLCPPAPSPSASLSPPAHFCSPPSSAPCPSLLAGCFSIAARRRSARGSLRPSHLRGRLPPPRPPYPQCPVLGRIMGNRLQPAGFSPGALSPPWAGGAVTADPFASLNRKAQQVDADWKPTSHQGNLLRVVLTQIFNPSYQELKLHDLTLLPREIFPAESAWRPPGKLSARDYLAFAWAQTGFGAILR